MVYVVCKGKVDPEFSWAVCEETSGVIVAYAKNEFWAQNVAGGLKLADMMREDVVKMPRRG